MNNSQGLRQLLGSIELYQQEGKTEVIIMDNESDDHPEIVVADYKDSLNIRHEISPDNGIYDAMNKGIDLAKGKAYYFIGSDDVLKPGFTKCFNYVHEDKVLYGNVIFKWSRQHYDGLFNSYKLAKKNICHQAIIYGRNSFENHHFDLKYPVYSDWVLNLKLWNDKTVRWKYLPFILAEYNENGISSNGKDDQFYQDFSINRDQMINSRSLARKIRDKISNTF